MRTPIILVASLAAGCSWLVEPPWVEGRPCGEGRCLKGYRCVHEVCERLPPCNASTCPAPGRCFDGRCLVAKAVATGGDHTCLKFDDESMACWGRNHYGQAGLGQIGSASTAQPVDGTDGTDIMSLGYNFSLALTRGAKVLAWGDNQKGQCARSPDEEPAVAHPTVVAALAGARDVYAGAWHACAHFADVSVRCWGRNVKDFLQIGGSDAVDVPAVVPGLAADRLVAGSMANYARLVLGQGWVGWGSNALGLLAQPPGGRVGGYTYDDADRVRTWTPPGGTTLTYAWDPAGHLLSVTPSKVPVQGYMYALLDLPEGVGDVSPNDGNFRAFDAAGNVTEITRPDGTSVYLGYDGAGRLSTVIRTAGTWTYTYNPATGRIDGVTGPGGGMTLSHDGALPTGTTWTGAVSGSVGTSYRDDLRVGSTTVNGSNHAYQVDTLAGEQ